MKMFSDEILTFANGDVDYFVAFKDYYNHYNKVNMSRSLGEFDQGVSLDEKSDKISKAFFREVEKRAGVERTELNKESWASNPNVGWAALAVIDASINAVLPATINPSIGLYTDLRYVGYGDLVNFKIKPRTLYTVSKGAHGERVTFRQKKYDGNLQLMPIEHIITTYVDMYKVLAGKEDLAEFVRLVVYSIETEMTKEATNALTTGMTASTYPTQLNVSGAFSAETLVTLAETVEAYNFGARPIIAGTATALMKVPTDASLNLRGIFDAEGGRIGLVKDFYGYDLLRLPQVATGNYSNFGLALDPDTLYIISPAMDKLVKGAVSTSLTNSNQFYDNADITQNFTMRKDFDFAFVSGAWGGIYKITD